MGGRKLPVAQTKTLFLRIPRMDWSRVRIGAKTQVRSPVGGQGWTPAAYRYAPTPAVAYCTNYRGENQTMMIILEEAWQEPLGAISWESIWCEGFDTLAEFKQYWLLRRDSETPGGVRPAWRPLDKVNVARFHPMTQDDYVFAASHTLQRLYGSYIPQEWVP